MLIDSFDAGAYKNEQVAAAVENLIKLEQFYVQRHKGQVLTGSLIAIGEVFPEERGAIMKLFAQAERQGRAITPTPMRQVNASPNAKPSTVQGGCVDCGGPKATGDYEAAVAATTPDPTPDPEATDAEIAGAMAAEAQKAPGVPPKTEAPVELKDIKSFRDIVRIFTNASEDNGAEVLRNYMVAIDVDPGNATRIDTLAKKLYKAKFA